jgi:hypothetical protein
MLPLPSTTEYYSEAYKRRFGVSAAAPSIMPVTNTATIEVKAELLSIPADFKIVYG